MFVINVANFENKMLLNFVFYRPSLSRETMEQLVNQVISSILDISSQPLKMRGA